MKTLDRIKSTKRDSLRIEENLTTGSNSAKRRGSANIIFGTNAGSMKTTQRESMKGE